MNFTKKDIILDATIYYALFHKKILGDTISQFLPNNSFGVFTTIRRNQKINKWPEDIHGCIGYWDDDYNELAKEVLLENLYRVAYDALWNDKRKEYFSPIQEDPETVIEIDFMMKPKYKISNEGIIEKIGIQFDNNIYGIIAVSSTGRATYLPKVFENIGWDEMKQSIKNKAGIIGEANFYAYKIDQINKRLCDIFSSGVIGNQILSTFINFLLNNANFSLKYPFPYEVQNNDIIFNEEEEVRNIATIGDLVIYLTNNAHFSNKKRLGEIKKSIENILRGTHSSQALSFLGFAINYFRLDKNKFCKQLTSDIDNAEEEFSKQEIIIGLKEANCPIKNYNLSFNEEDSVFKMNWTIQALTIIGKKIDKKLVEILLSRIENLEDWETNYLAVCWEALCYLKNYKVQNKMFQLFYELEKRRNELGLYEFKNGSARIDITGHVCNGFNKLQTN